MVFVGAYFACWLCLHGANNESDRQSHSYTRTYITLGIISIKNQLSMSAYYVIIVHTERRVRSTKMLPSWRDNLYAILHSSRYMILWKTSNWIQDHFSRRVFALYVCGILSLRCSPINQHAEILAIFSIFRTNHWSGNIRKIIFLTIFIHCKVLYRVILGALQNTPIKKCLHNNFNACIKIFKWMCAQYRSQTDAFSVTAIWIDRVQKSFVEFWAIGQIFASILPQILTLLSNSRIEKAMNFSMLYQI